LSHPPTITTDLTEAVRAAVIEALAKRPQVQWRGVRGQAERLDISERLLRSWISRPVNPMPASKVGGRVLIHDNEADSWLRGQRLGRDLDLLAEKTLADLRK